MAAPPAARRMLVYPPRYERSDVSMQVVQAAALSCVLVPITAATQDGAAAFETLVVTGTRIPHGEYAAHAHTLIDADDIALRNDANVLDLLSDVPGVHVNLPGSRGSLGELFIRGGDPNFTSVLIDGVQVNDPTNTRGGSFDFSTLNLDDVDHIEVLRGPSSPIYGSDALSGAVNIVTHGARSELDGRVAAEVSSGSYERANMHVAGPFGRSSGFSIGLGVIDDGDANSSDALENEFFSAKLSLAQDRRTRVSVFARHSATRASSFPDSSGGPVLAILREHATRDSDETAASLALTSSLSPTSELHFAATRYDHGELAISPGVAPGVASAIPANRADSDFSRSTANLFLRTRLADRFDVALGIELRRENGASAGEIEFAPGVIVPSGYSLDRDSSSAYAEIAFDASANLDVVAALRSDDPDAGNRESTGKMTLSYRVPNRKLTARLSWADAFKLPSLFGLADPLVGNPELRPERVDSLEAGLDFGALDGALTWQITVFKQRFEDLIDFDFATFRTVNRNRVDTDGVEIGGRYQVSDRLSLTAHATRTDIEVLGSPVNLRQRPDTRGGAGLLWDASPALTLHAEWLYVGERFDSAIPTGEQELPSYSRVDLALTWDASTTTRVNLALDNALDEAYFEAIGFPAVGRQLRLSARRSFGR